MSTKKKKTNTQLSDREFTNTSGRENNRVVDNDEINKYNLDLVNTWIANLDTKVSISCGIFSIVIAVLVFTSENYFNNLEIVGVKRSCCLIAFGWNAVLAGLSFVISVIMHFVAITPNMFGEKKEKDNKIEYSIFYENIRKFKDVNAYKEEVKKARENNFTDELLNEIYYNSVICSKKMHLFTSAVRIGTVSIILTITSVVLYYFAYV